MPIPDEVHLLDGMLHMRAVMSEEEDARCLPSGANLTAETARLCPVSVAACANCGDTDMALGVEQSTAAQTRFVGGRDGVVRVHCAARAMSDGVFAL